VNGPRQGDVFGELLRDALAVQTGVGPRPMVARRLPRPVIEIIERDDGLINGAPAAHYLDGPDLWEPYDRRAVDRVRGEVLDVGAGAGRIALVLQERGVPVTGLDISPGAIGVARARGVRDLVCSTVDDHAAGDRRYDTFLLLGNNLGLLEGRERAPAFLAALAALARSGAQIIAQGTDPYGTNDPVHVGYHEFNRRRGRLGGQLRLRLRYRDLSTAWFDYLVCSTDELGQLVAGTPWRLVDIDDADAPIYLATLRLVG
jgi:SAM-dependent methyltransferase